MAANSPATPSWPGLITPVSTGITSRPASRRRMPSSRASTAGCGMLGGGRPNALFFAGDLGQRIFQQPFSWKAFGVDVRGRSRTLRVNYRTSHQIPTQPDRLLGPQLTDVDGNHEDRSDTVSGFNGPPPSVRALTNEREEIETVSTWIADRVKHGVLPPELGVFVRFD